MSENYKVLDQEYLPFSIVLCKRAIASVYEGGGSSLELSRTITSYEGGPGVAVPIGPVPRAPVINSCKCCQTVKPTYSKGLSRIFKRVSLFQFDLVFEDI